MLINIYGAPGSGKSTLALYLTGFLKSRGLNAEYVPEYVKTMIALGDRSWNEVDVLSNQYRVLSAFYRTSDIVVTDSPILNSAIYCEEEDIKDDLWHLTYSLNERFTERLDILVLPCPLEEEYVTSLRIQSHCQSLELHDRIFSKLMPYDLEISVMGPNRKSLGDISNDILSVIQK